MKTETERIEKYDDMVNGNDLFTDELRQWLINQGFFVKPAAIVYHGNYSGGLFDHSAMVANILIDMTHRLDFKWQRPESPLIIGMLHDTCKLDDYIDKNASDIVVMGTGSPISKNPEWVRNTESILGTGHGDKSVMMLSQFINMTEEEILCIRYHMGAYKTKDWTAFDLAIRRYETVLWTHTADMYASKVQNV